MKNRIKFFIDKEKDIYEEYYNVPIPQRKSIVFLRGEKFIVNDITYEYEKFEEDPWIETFNLINIYVEHMEDEDFE